LGRTGAGRSDNLLPATVAYFKASLIGFHVTDHGLDPEDEVATLRTVMQAFSHSVEEAKTGKPRLAGQAYKREPGAERFEDVD